MAAAFVDQHRDRRCRVADNKMTNSRIIFATLFYPSSFPFGQIAKHDDAERNDFFPMTLLQKRVRRNFRALNVTELVERYRRYAEKCLHLVQNFSDPEAKRSFLAMANAWLMLAAQREKTLESAHPGESPFPVDEPPPAEPPPPPIDDPPKPPIKEPPPRIQPPPQRLDAISTFFSDTARGRGVAPS